MYDYCEQIKNQSWHPMNKSEIKNKDWNMSEFKQMVNSFNKFRALLNERSTEYCKSYMDKSIQIYEVSLFNIYDPSKMVIQYPWVYKNVNDPDWPDFTQIKIFNKYGWSIEIK